MKNEHSRQYRLVPARQIDNVKDTLGGNKSGNRQFVNGEETESKKAKATVAIIAVLAAVISAYASMPH